MTFETFQLFSVINLQSHQLFPFVYDDSCSLVDNDSANLLNYSLSVISEFHEVCHPTTYSVVIEATGTHNITGNLNYLQAQPR